MADIIKLDIISDVVCPWCIIGYRRLQKAISDMGLQDNVEIEWQPFELNPHMPANGEEIVGHMSGKYGMTPNESNRSLMNMADLGAEIGFTFDFFEGMKMVNTRDVHILLEYAKAFDKQTELKMRLFEAFFSERKDVSDRQVLLQEIHRVGLDVDEAIKRLDDASVREHIGAEETFWRRLGVSSVPTMIFNRSSALKGAQPVEVYKQVLAELVAQ